ncbi:flagellar hook-basal body protein FliE [Algimonas arctica]|uniref:Flagellar hook-basal body complex protein FliE n=1 Tax=Algimonas arctica TaxID=1479486 RepID=A0A8J3G1Z4_9PROT|nr:flagellar hook-basal body complex protein FliE [Algimonas arctica]GHA89321.1 flagellar hook-basal body protein FliE [Algimonas arctica]
MDITSNAAALGASRHYGAAKRITAPAGLEQPKPNNDGGVVAKGVESFSDVLKTVETTSTQYAAGTTDAQSVVEALANAEMALETAVTVRNRVVEAYQELLRMPI